MPNASRSETDPGDMGLSGPIAGHSMQKRKPMCSPIASDFYRRPKLDVFASARCFGIGASAGRALDEIMSVYMPQSKKVIKEDGVSPWPAPGSLCVK